MDGDFVVVVVVVGNNYLLTRNRVNAKTLRVVPSSCRQTDVSNPNQSISCV